MFCAAFEHMAQVEFRVESVELRRTEQRVDSSSTLATSVRADEEEDDMALRVSQADIWSPHSTEGGVVASHLGRRESVDQGLK
jgi:hypothetical protein